MQGLRVINLILDLIEVKSFGWLVFIFTFSSFLCFFLIGSSFIASMHLSLWVTTSLKPHAAQKIFWISSVVSLIILFSVAVIINLNHIIIYAFLVKTFFS